MVSSWLTLRIDPSSRNHHRTREGICTFVEFVDSVTAHAVGTAVEVGRINGPKALLPQFQYYPSQLCCWTRRTLLLVAIRSTHIRCAGQTHRPRRNSDAMKLAAHECWAFDWCGATKSSYLDLAPGANEGSDFEGLLKRHLAALEYAIFSSFESEALFRAATRLEAWEEVTILDELPSYPSRKSI